VPGYAIWKPRPIFVSSTFQDMQAERDYLHSVVFLAIEEQLRKRFHFLEPIDLRMGIGVTEIPEKDLIVLRVCLDEIRRSRPFFIGILGDRYGWVPPVSAAQAVASEAGYREGVAGISVTALEMELGALADPAQRDFCRFYFREPLPYKKMPRELAARYSDEYCDDPGAVERRRALTELKQRIVKRMGNRVRSYHAEWDESAGRVTGLEAWGKQVEQDLWADLERATRADARAQPATWQESEDLILEEFIAGSSREFVGRDEALQELLRFASDANPHAPFLEFVIGWGGSGKSSLFGEMVRRLQSEPGVLVLAHAAGISAQSSRLETMLGRWNATLAQAAGVDFADQSRNPLPNGRGSVSDAKLTEPRVTEPRVTEPRLTEPRPLGSGRQGAERRFASLLASEARGRRVVCLIDGLDRFEQTDAARYLQWLPRDWPANARLIVTTGGSNVDALAGALGAKMLSLGSLSAPDARRLIEDSCQRHHTVFSEEVKTALAPADRSPLWLHLALSRLLILDTSDLADAERRYTGDAEGRLQSFRRDLAAQFPATADGLYERLLERMAGTYRQDWLKGICRLLAVSRHGFRDADLRSTVPRLTGSDWSELEFANLRRGFRGELVQRGPFGQWDFAHSQARRSIERRWLGDEAGLRDLHRLVARHLQQLPEGDALRQSELMYHLIQADLPDSAAEYAAKIDPRNEVEVRAATQALASEIGTRNAGLEWVASLLDRPADLFAVQAICALFLDRLIDALADSGPDAGLAVVEAVCGALKRVGEDRTLETVARRELAVGLDRWGELLGERGRDEEALGKYEDALRYREALWLAAPESREVARDVSVSLDRLMGHAMKAGRLELAEELCRKDLAIALTLYERFPGDVTQRDRFVSCLRAGDLLARMERNDAAIAAYQQALEAAADLAHRDGESDARARDLAAVEQRLGELRNRTGDHAGAAELYAQALAIRENLYRRNPESQEDARDLMALYGLAAEFHLGRYAQFQCHAYEISRALYRKHPGRLETARDHVVSSYRLAVMYRALGHDAEARELNLECLNLLRDLPPAFVQSDPDLVELARYIG